MNKNCSIAMSSQLYNYIENEILILYDNLDDAHNKQHILNVIERSASMNKLLNVDNNILLTAAAYHDLGLVVGRKKHEKISAQFFLQDDFMKEWFSCETMKVIAESIEDHRSILKRRPRSIYGEILHDVDTFGGNLTELIVRSIAYGKQYFYNYTKIQHFERIYTYLNEKYGVNGYATLYINYTPHQKNYSEIIERLKSKEHIWNIFNKYF